MSLPKLSHPTFELKIPSSGNKFLFRPYTVKEQKILLTLKDSGDEKEVTDLLLQLLASTCLSEGFNPKKLSYFDVEYLFMKLRAKSVGEIVDLSYKCNNPIEGSPCGTINSFPINLDGVEVNWEGSSKREFPIQDGLTVKMSYPNLQTMGLVESYNQSKNLEDLIGAIADCVENVKDEDSIYTEFTKEEMIGFITGLNISSFESFLEFFVDLPKIKEKVNFKCKKCGYTDVITISGLLDFFV